MFSCKLLTVKELAAEAIVDFGSRTVSFAHLNSVCFNALRLKAAGKSWFDYHEGDFEALLATAKQARTDRPSSTSERSPEVATIP